MADRAGGEGDGDAVMALGGAAAVVAVLAGLLAAPLILGSLVVLQDASWRTRLAWCWLVVGLLALGLAAGTVGLVVVLVGGSL